jgi:predicted HTH domain antitoxin
MTTRKIVIDVAEEVLLAEKTDESAFARELRMLAAVKLYELGRLTSGRAAALAGVSRVEFLSSLGRYRVFPFEAELEGLASNGVAEAGAAAADGPALARWLPKQ